MPGSNHYSNWNDYVRIGHGDYDHGMQVKLIYLNARSLKGTNKFDEVLLMVNAVSPDIVAITETWFSPGEERLLHGIPEYLAHAVSREGKRGGGVILYKSEEYSSKMLSICNKFHSILSVLVKNGNSNLNIVLAYNPNKRNTEWFLQDLESCLPMKNCPQQIVLGDFNIDLLNSDGTFQEYLDLMAAYGLANLNFTCPTRPESGTLIDHVFVTESLFDGTSLSSIMTDISDHNLLILSVPLPRPVNRQHSEIDVVSVFVNYNLVNAYFSNNPLNFAETDVENVCNLLLQ